MSSETPVGAILSRDGEILSSNPGKETIQTWRTSPVRKISTKDLGDRLSGFDFSPDGRFLITVEGEDGRVHIWDAHTMKPVKALDGHRGAIASVAFSLDGKFVATGGDDYTVRLWDAISWTLIRTLSSHSGKVFHVSFSRDSKFLLTLSTDGSVRLWDMNLGTNVATSNEGRAIGEFFDLYPGRLPGPPLPGLNVLSAALSDDNRFIAIGKADGTTHIFDVEDNRSLIVFRRLLTPVVKVAFSPDDRHVIAVGSEVAPGYADREVRIYDCEVCGSKDHLLALARTRLLPVVH